MSQSALSLRLYQHSLLPLLITLAAGLHLLSPRLLNAADIPPIVATVEEQPIAAEELTTALRGELIRLDMERYRLLQQKLDELIADRLLRLEASKRGITPQQLEQEEVIAKTAAISADQINAFYEANKQRIRQPLEQIKPRIQDYLQRQEQHKRQQEFLKTLRQRYAVKVALRAPRVDVDADDDPFLGPADAPVTIIEFSDFQCPYCRRVQPTLKRLLQEYEGKIKLVFRDFPLHNIHPLAQKAAEAAQCAADQQQFWPYHDKLFAKSSLQQEDFKQFAQELNLDLEQFTTCLDAGKYAREVARDLQAGANAGVSATPSFFVNGHPINGAASYNHFKEIIEAALAAIESNKQTN